MKEEREKESNTRTYVIIFVRWRDDDDERMVSSGQSVIFRRVLDIR